MNPRTISYTITDPVEDANVAGWVNKGYSEPDWQPTKLVSEERSRRRWAEVAAAYPELGPQQPQPPQPPSSVYVQADLQFNGARYDTVGVVGSTVACMRLTVPSDCSGKKASIAVFENGSGMFWRHATLSRTPGDMSPQPPACDGASGGANLYLAIDSSAPGAVTVRSGEVWYLNVAAEYWMPTATRPYRPSAAPGVPCDFGVKLYQPT